MDGLSGMDVKEIVNERLKRKYEIVLPVGKIAELEKEKLEEVQSTAHLRGFRPGKVPMSLIKRRFGDSVRSSVLDEQAKSVLDEFLKSKDEKPVAGVKVDLEDRADEDSDYVITVDYECKPPIPEVDLSSIDLEKFVADIDDEFVNRAVRLDMRRLPKFEDAPEGHAARMGDCVRLNYRIVPLDSEEPPTEEKPTLVVIESCEDNEENRLEAALFDLPHPGGRKFLNDRFGMAEHLIGMKVGDKSEFEMDIPAIALAEPRLGKRAVFSIEIKGIDALSDYSDEEEFAKRIDFASIDAYRVQVMARLKRHYDELCRKIMIEDLIRKLGDKLAFDAPETLVDREIEYQKQNLGYSPSSDQKGDAGEAGSSESDSGMTEAGTSSGGEMANSEGESRIRKLAERRVKHFMFLEDLASKHKISLESNDVLDFVGTFASSESHKAELIDRLQKDADYRQRILNLAITEKTTNFALELSNAEIRKASPEEVIKACKERFEVSQVDDLDNPWNDKRVLDEVFTSL